MNINEVMQICWQVMIRVKCMCGVSVCSVQCLHQHTMFVLDCAVMAVGQTHLEDTHIFIK